MTTPDWQRFLLHDGILRETSPNNDRIVFWLSATNGDRDYQWERVSSVPDAVVHVDQGICATSATLIRAKKQSRGLVGKLLGRFRRDSDAPLWELPNGTSLEQCGSRQTDLVLAWAEDESSPLDESRLRSRWPGSKRLQKVGDNLFVVSGVKPAVVRNDVPAGAAGNCPKAQAEQILAEAKRSGNRHAEATALIDLAAVYLQSKEAPRAITLLQEAAPLAAGNRAVEIEALGTLGLSLLTVGQIPQARQVFEQTLTYAREVNDPVAEKLTLERMGVACSRLRDQAQAFACFEQALTLARRLGDRKHEGELLWYLAIEHAEAGQREEAMTQAHAAVEVLKALKRPEATALANDLAKYEQEQSGSWPTGVSGPITPADSFPGGSFTVSAATLDPSKPAAGPSLLRMAMSAARSMSHYVANGMKTVSPEARRQRLEVCAGCPQHTGLRCRVCGCFTNVKTWLPHEACPLGKWQRM